MSQPAPIPPSVTVKAGHVQPVWAGHPWVFKQAVEKVDGEAAPGDEVLVIDPHGKVLGRGLYSPKSAIAVRIYSREGSRAIDAELLREQVARAVRFRQAVGLPDVTPERETTGCRLIHGEGDGLPGLIVDAFQDVLVVQLGTLGLYRRREQVVAALCDVVGPRAIIDRTPKSVSSQEGFAPAEDGDRLLFGEAPDELRFHELGLSYGIPLSLAQKTGFYFDQRPLRQRLAPFCRGSRVLDGFCYVAAMGLNAARAGAREVWCVDKSKAAIEVAEKLADTHPWGERMRFDVMDASKAFRKAAEAGGYDLVICDPPKLSASRRSRGRAFGAYRKLAASACRATAVGGVLAFCSCSGNTDMDQLQRALALGAREAGRRAVIFDRCFQGPDHPVVAAFPEGLYLKVLLARVEAG